MRKSSRETGRCFEEQAASYLEKQGYKILERNFRCHSGEVDLIGRDGEYLCFIEVKYREGFGYGHPLMAVGYEKQRRICKTALFYLTVKGLSDTTACRFDVVGITPQEVCLIKDAFSFCA